MAAFPRLALKFNEKILPARQQAAWYGKYRDVGGLATFPGEPAAASKSNNTSKPIPQDAAAAVDFQQDIDGSKDQNGSTAAQGAPVLDNFQLSLQPVSVSRVYVARIVLTVPSGCSPQANVTCMRLGH